MDSPLTNLCKTLEIVRDSASSYTDRLKTNEAVTRAVLIDPILRALGWDTGNPTKVEVEKPITIGGKSTFVDYALLDGEPRILVEAKKLGENLEAGYFQVANYANMCGVKSFFLTDGIRWWHYENMMLGESKPVECLDLRDENLPYVAAYFVKTLDAALVAPDKRQEDELLAKVQQLDRRLERLETKPAASSDDATLGMSTNTDSVIWTEINSSKNFKYTRPMLVRLPDGSVEEVNTWSQVLVASAHFAFKNHPKLFDKVPLKDKAQASVYLAQNNPYPSNTSSSPILVDSNQIYLRTHYSANDCAANSEYLTSRLPVSLRKSTLAVQIVTKEKPISEI